MSRWANLLWDPSSGEFDVATTDILVIGGGVAGFTAAIAVGGKARVLCVTKDTALTSNTQRAQGGVAAVLSDEDSIEAHRDDTLAAGVDLCELETVETVVSEGPLRVRELIEWGGNFDQVGGKFHLTLEGGHSRKRVLHAHGDQTGMEVQSTLLKKVKVEGVELWEHGFAVDLIIEDGRCLGALIFRAGRFIVVWARATILATGGAGQIYRESTNPLIATGDGIAMAIRAGARLRDMEFVQFHPTTLYVAGSARHLITEAVRGEGGVLRDMRGDRFMVLYHPDAELAPRDVVSRAIVSHMTSTGDSHMFLDLSHLEDDFVRERFPKLTEVCRLYNLDVASDPIPIHPSVHYLMGGVTVDLEAKTSIEALYACGEVASSGLHGANRLASNSLLEGLVFGYRAGKHAVDHLGAHKKIKQFRAPEFSLEGSVINVPDMLNSIKSLMWRDVGIVRSKEGLVRARRCLADWSNYVLQCCFTNSSGWELVNVMTCAHAIAASALRRTESRGAHFRSDFPERNDAEWLRHTAYPIEIHA